MIRLITILLSFSLSSFAFAGGNSVFIEQIGTSNNTVITINQDGEDNSVNFTMNHDDNEIIIDQEGNNNTVSNISLWGPMRDFGGDLDGTNNNIKIEQHITTGTDANKVGFHITGNNNEIHVCQGATFSGSSDTICSGTTPTSEHGGHTVNLDVHASGNDIKVGQETNPGNADHYAQIYYYGGDNNNTFLTQKGSGNKTLNMTVRTDGGEQELIQKGEGSHTATVELTGSQKTDLSMTQQGNTTQSYSLTQNCQTSGGCSVSVIQGN